MEIELTRLDSIEQWMTIVVAGVTIFAIVIGGGAAFWRFVLQQPYGNHWDVRVSSCSLRRVGEELAYMITITIENRSRSSRNFHGWWRQIRFPDEVSEDYDPNGTLVVNSGNEADEYYGPEGSGAVTPSPYTLAAGEAIIDHFIRPHEGTLHELCFVEYTLEYRGATWIPFREGDVETVSQRTTAPVVREDLLRYRSAQTN